MAITAPTVSGDQHPRCCGVARVAQVFPPLRNCGDRKLGRIMRDPNRDPGFVVRKVIDSVGNRFPELGIGKVVRIDFERFPFGAILSAPVFLVAQQFLLLRVDRDRWASAAPLRCHTAIDVGELRIAIRMVFAFSCLTIRL